MGNMIFRRAFEEEMPRILAMQSDVFSGEQGIPSDDIDTFMKKQPLCWCAEMDGKIYAAVAAWNEGDEVHWGRFVVFPESRGQHIGSRLARYSFDDLFQNGAEKLYMDARDATVRIVCGMGGRVTGEPYRFYDGNVTPVTLERKDYLNGCKDCSEE